MTTLEALEAEVQIHSDLATPKETPQPFSHVVGTDTVLQTGELGFIAAVDTESGVQYSGFVDTALQTTGQPYLGDYATTTRLRVHHQSTAHILLPDDKDLQKNLITRDTLQTSPEKRVDAQHQIHDRIKTLLTEHGWVFLSGFSPDPKDPDDPDNFHFAQHIGIPVRNKDGSLTGIMTLPPGIYPIDYPERVARSEAALPKDARDILRFNREHAFVTLVKNSRNPVEDWYISGHGGKENLVSFPGGIMGDPESRFRESIRYVIQRNTESITIFLARVYGAYFDFNTGTISVPDDSSIGHIRGAGSERLKTMTDIVIETFAREYYKGDERQAINELAKRWRQKNAQKLGIDIKINPSMATSGIEALEKRFEVTLTGWEKPIHSEMQMTSGQAEDVLNRAILKKAYSVGPDFTGAGSKPYATIAISENDLIGTYGSTDSLSFDDLTLVENLMISTNDGDKKQLYRLRIIGREEDDIILVAGSVTTQEGEKTTETFCAGRIRIPQDELKNGISLKFHEFGTADTVETLAQLRYAEVSSLRLLCMKIWQQNATTRTPDEITQLFDSLLPTDLLRMRNAGTISEIQIALNDQALPVST
jgi:hypothetical protein